MSSPNPPTPTSAWGYRGHLDGLRTVAVYSVLLYHARVPWMSGGFIGVDLFFTLSGFLVTSVLLVELNETGRLRLARFYARRVRRLLPAAAALVVGVAVIALLSVAPAARVQLVDDARASSLWFANWHFIIESNDYFAVDSTESPFIHFWSLAIEEQFYLAFPLFLLGLRRLGGRRLLGVAITALLVASLVSQWYWASRDVNRAYLGTDARVYQILAGAVLAVALEQGRRTVTGSQQRLAQATAVIALVTFIASATSLWDVSASARGVIAASTAVALIGALESAGPSAVTRALSVRPMRYLGQISYGTYLWHWPVLVVARSLLDMSTLAQAVLATTVGTGLAALSAELVELPIRRSRALDRVPRSAIAAGVTLAVFTGLAIAPMLLDSSRRPAVSAATAAPTATTTASGPVPSLDWKVVAEQQPDVPSCEAADASDCFVGPQSGETILLVGDSHARMFIPAFTEIASARGMSLAVSFSPSCPWQRSLLAGATDDRFSDRCRVTRERTFEVVIPALDPAVVVVAGFPRSTGVGGGAHTDRADWADLPLENLVAVATATTVDTLTELDVPLLMIEPVPILPANQLICLSGAADVAECAFTPDPPGVEEAVMRRLAAEIEAVGAVDLDDDICPALVVCDAVVDDVVVRRDGHHLTPEFALTLVTPLGAALDDVAALGAGAR